MEKIFNEYYINCPFRVKKVYNVKIDRYSRTYSYQMRIDGQLHPIKCIQKLPEEGHLKCHFSKIRQFWGSTMSDIRSYPKKTINIHKRILAEPQLSQSNAKSQKPSIPSIIASTNFNTKLTNNLKYTYLEYDKSRFGKFLPKCITIYSHRVEYYSDGSISVGYSYHKHLDDTTKEENYHLREPIVNRLYKQSDYNGIDDFVRKHFYKYNEQYPISICEKWDKIYQADEETWGCHIELTEWKCRKSDYWYVSMCDILREENPIFGIKTIG